MAQYTGCKGSQPQTVDVCLYRHRSTNDGRAGGRCQGSHLIFEQQPNHICIAICFGIQEEQVKLERRASRLGERSIDAQRASATVPRDTVQLYAQLAETGLQVSAAFVRRTQIKCHAVGTPDGAVEGVDLPSILRYPPQLVVASLAAWCWQLFTYSPVCSCSWLAHLQYGPAFRLLRNVHVPDTTSAPLTPPSGPASAAVH